MSTKSKSGFTIIEVVLVLAIAGLIFLMVFIALPNMQRSQRDTRRRNDYAALSANITAYITNNNGSLPTAARFTALTDAPKKYINESGEDPDGNQYQLSVVDCKGSSADNCGASFTSEEVAGIRENGSAVRVVTHASCDEGVLKPSNSNRAFAIYGQLETGDGTYCQSTN